MNKRIENFIFLSILFLIFSFHVFSADETKAYYDCSQYGYATYSDGSGYCKCTTGYLMDDNFAGAPYCVSGLSYCYDKYGYDSDYDFLSNNCKCRSGYTWEYNTYGSQRCVKKKSKDEICKDNLGSSTSYDSYSGQCKCNFGYVIDKDIFGEETCVSGGLVCLHKYGLGSKYDSLSNECGCNYGYELTQKTGGFECKSCSSKYGLYSSYNSIANKCECDNGYTLDENNSCVKKQNNVYFLLKELNSNDKQAIIRSEYDYNNYLITYGSGCYNFSIKRYLKNKIVVNLGTDFHVDIGDKIVLSDDNETCEIRKVQKVSSIYSLETTDEIYIQSKTTQIVKSATPTILIISEGAIVRAENDIDVYIVKYIGSKKFKRLVLSPSVFKNYGHLKWGNLMVVSPAILNSFTTSDLVRAVGDSKIYKLYPQGDSGQKRLIKDTTVLTKLGFDPDSIYEINSFDRESYVTGVILE